MRLFAALILLLLLASALAGPPAARAQGGASASDAASVERTLISNERRTWELYKNKDVKGLHVFYRENVLELDGRRLL